MAELEKVFLRFMLEATARQTKLILQEITPTQLQAIGEVCLNLMHGSITEDLLRDLKPFRGLIRQLADKSLSTKRRKQITVKQSKQLVQVLILVQGILP